jgi:hypothetical protein
MARNSQLHRNRLCYRRRTRVAVTDGHGTGEQAQTRTGNSSSVLCGSTLTVDSPRPSRTTSFREDHDLVRKNSPCAGDLSGSLHRLAITNDTSLWRFPNRPPFCLHRLRHGGVNTRFGIVGGLSIWIGGNSTGGFVGLGDPNIPQ